MCITKDSEHDRWYSQSIGDISDDIFEYLQIHEQRVRWLKRGKKAKEFVNSRIHVERPINRMKKYQIFKGTLPITMMQYADEIVFVCAEFCNMKNVLIQTEKD